VTGLALVKFSSASRQERSSICGRRHCHAAGLQSNAACTRRIRANNFCRSPAASPPFGRRRSGVRHDSGSINRAGPSERLRPLIASLQHGTGRAASPLSACGRALSEYQIADPYETFHSSSKCWTIRFPPGEFRHGIPGSLDAEPQGRPKFSGARSRYRRHCRRPFPDGNNLCSACRQRQPIESP